MSYCLRISIVGTGRTTSFFSCSFMLIGLVLVPGILVGVTHAQEVQSTTKPAEQDADGVPPSLVGVPGVIPGMTNNQLLELANRALEAQRLIDAEKIAWELVNKDQQNMSLLRLLADVYERIILSANKDTSNPDAEKLAKKYVQMAVNTYFHMAKLSQDSANWVVAEEMYNRLLVHEPAHRVTQLGLAQVYAATDRNLQAIGYYRHYLKDDIGKQNPAAFIALGKLCRLQKYHFQAISALQSAKKIDPENPEIYAELAYTKMDNNERDEALKSIQTAISKDPQNPAYYNAYSKFLLASRYLSGDDLQNANNQALTAVKKARDQLRANPENLSILTSLNEYYSTYKETLTKILRKDPESITTRIDLAQAIQENATVNQALSLYLALNVLTQIEAKGEGNIRLLELLADVRFSVNKYKEAVETCRRLLKKDPNNSVAKDVMGKIPTEFKTTPTTNPTTTPATNPAGPAK